MSVVTATLPFFSQPAQVLLNHSVDVMWTAESQAWLAAQMDAFSHDSMRMQAGFPFQSFEIDVEALEDHCVWSVQGDFWGTGVIQ